MSHRRRATKSSAEPGRDSAQTIRQIYRVLSQAWGPQHWWPAQTPFEVIVGAILTQNTSWTNVERAIGNLRNAGVLSLEGIRNLSLAKLEVLVRPSGYFRQKARRLKGFVEFVDARHGGSLEQMLALPSAELRPQLLERNGIGMETADSILLYAGLKPVFVVDAYTRRIFDRHHIIHSAAAYEDIRALVEQALSVEEAVPSHWEEASEALPKPPVHAASAMSMARQSQLGRVYNEMHGLMVQLGKHYCSKQRPDCDNCPVGNMLSPEERQKLQVGVAVGRKK